VSAQRVVASTVPNPRYPSAYHGGVVIHDPNIRIVIWGPGYPPAISTAIEMLIRSLAGSAYASVLTEYYDTTGHIHNDIRLAGAWTDPLPPRPLKCRTKPTTTCLTTDQMRTEVSRAITQNHWPLDANTVVLLLLPPGLSDEDTGCGFHMSFKGSFPQGPPAIAVVNYPQAPCQRGPDPTAYAEFVAMHELAEAITDPFNGAIPGQRSGWWDLGVPSLYSFIGEIADACDPNSGDITLVDGSHAHVPELYSITDHACRPVP
jgi:hypothetical protein